MSRSEQEFLLVLGIVLALALVMSGIVRWVHWKARTTLPDGETVGAPNPGGLILGILECYFYFAVLSTEGAGYLAGAWLAFKLATRWQSAPYAKPTPIETRVQYRAFQVGTIGNLLVGIIGAAIMKII